MPALSMLHKCLINTVTIAWTLTGTCLMEHVKPWLHIGRPLSSFSSLSSDCLHVRCIQSGVLCRWSFTSNKNIVWSSDQQDIFWFLKIRMNHVNTTGSVNVFAWTHRMTCSVCVSVIDQLHRRESCKRNHQVVISVLSLGSFCSTSIKWSRWGTQVLGIEPK